MSFTFGSDAAAASPTLFFSGNAMSAMSETVGVDIAQFLIREAAEEEREMIRKNALERLKNISGAAFKWKGEETCAHCFTRWEARPKDPLQTEVGREFRQCNDAAMLVKEAEGIWDYHQNFLANSKSKEIFSVSEFNHQYKASGYIIEREGNGMERGGNSIVQEAKGYSFYTTKSAYYQSRLTKTAKRYGEEMVKFRSEMKQVNEWENDMLTANNIDLKTPTFFNECQDMYDHILDVWETKTPPFKAASKQAPPSTFGQKATVSTIADLPESTSKKTPAPQGFPFKATSKPSPFVGQAAPSIVVWSKAPPAAFGQAPASTFGQQTPPSTFANLPDTSAEKTPTPQPLVQHLNLSSPQKSINSIPYCQR